jgi:putative copper export protein
LVLLAGTVWTGAIALSLLVVAPARARASFGAQRLLADAMLERAGQVIQVAVPAALAASLVELAAQAYAAGGIQGVVSGAAVGALLTSQYGHWWLAWVLLAALVSLVLSVGARVERLRRLEGTVWRRLRHLPAMRQEPSRIGEALVGPWLWAVSLLGMVYLLAVALSGHAATVPVLAVSAVGLDWLHLLANTVWIGGMAAMALALLPAARVLAERGEESVHVLAALLDLLDRYSPAAYLALATAAFTGMFNAQIHLAGLSDLFTTTYGRILLAKLAAIGAIMALSASHVCITRPRLRRLLPGVAPVAARAGIAALARRLRMETALGAIVLLCAALMGQAAPAATIASSTTSRMTASAPATFSATHGAGSLSATLTVSPPTVGRARFTVTVRDQGKPLTAGQVRIRLSVPGEAAIGDLFVETTNAAGTYRGAGDLVQDGAWQADVLVRTPDDPLDYRDIPFRFTVGANAAFQAPMPVSMPGM